MSITIWTKSPHPPCLLSTHHMCTQQGWPFVKGNFDDALCPNVWWHIPWFQALRYVLWIFLFVLSVVLFFFTTCIFMPRLNGRRDTTGLCGTCVCSPFPTVMHAITRVCN